MPNRFKSFSITTARLLLALAGILLMLQKRVLDHAQVLAREHVLEAQEQVLTLVQRLVHLLVQRLALNQAQVLIRIRVLVYQMLLILLSQKNSKTLSRRAVNFVDWVPRDYQAMLLDKFATFKRRKTNRVIIYILIGWEFGPLVLNNTLGALQQIFRKDRA